MKKVLVTGADGFIGSHLVERLVEQGFHVRAFVFYNSFNTWGWLDTIEKSKLKNVEIISGDIRDPFGVQKAMKDIDLVFHLAALIGIPFSYHSPVAYIDTNVNGTLNVLQAARDLGTERIIVTSTSEIYGTAQYVPIDEKHPREGQSPYSASKIAADALAGSFNKSFNLPVIIARPFNTYGPRQSARAIIPTIISQLINGSSVIKLGALTPTRDMVFVKDTVTGFIKISQCEHLIGKEVNISTGYEISMGDLAKKIIDIINPRAIIKTDEIRLRPANSEVIRLLGDNSLLLKETNWKPQTTLEQGLSDTIGWFKQNDNIKYYKDLYNI
jgi:NAD dependent epimerase/dehydratase